MKKKKKAKKLFWATIFALAFLFFYALMHELTHLVFCMKFGLNCYITISPFGFETRVIDGNLTESEKYLFVHDNQLAEIVGYHLFPFYVLFLFWILCRCHLGK